MTKELLVLRLKLLLIADVGPSLTSSCSTLFFCLGMIVFVQKNWHHLLLISLNQLIIT